MWVIRMVHYNIKDLMELSLGRLILLIECIIQNAVTHLNNNPKNYVMVIWVPPAGFNGQIVFR